MKVEVVVGLNYGPRGTRVEPGEVHDFPKKVADKVIAKGWGTLATDATPEPAQEA